MKKCRIIKKISTIIMTGCLALAASGCGGSTVTTTQKEEKVFPQKIENVFDNPIIPEGSEATVNEKGNYPLDALWGEWIPEGWDYDGEDLAYSDEHLTENTFTVFPWSGKDEDEDNERELDVFPCRLEFVPAEEGLHASGRMNNSIQDMTVDLLWDSTVATNDEEKEQADASDTFGLFLEKNGYGFGCAEYVSPEFEENNGMSNEEFNRYLWQVRDSDPLENKIAYSIQGEDLVIGISDMDYYFDSIDDFNGKNEIKVEEIRYKINIHGEKMELSYGDETITYIPEIMTHDTWGETFHIENAGPVGNHLPAEDIMGITMTNNGGALMKDIHDGYLGADYTFFDNPDMVQIDCVDGSHYEYQYIYSGDCFSLIEGDDFHIYSPFAKNMASYSVRAQPSFLLDGEAVRLNHIGEWDTIGSLLGYGFQTDVDINQQIGSTQVTEEIELYYQDARLIVKGCNPYSESVPLKECVVCSCYTDDDSGTIKKGWGINIGKTTYTESFFNFEAPFKVEDNILRYKAGNVKVNYSSISNLPSKPLIDESDIEVVFDFDDMGILRDFRFELPAFLYNGMQDNIFISSENDIGNIDANVFSGIKQTRDTILGRLEDEFSKQNIDVNINHNTGEIVMGSDILFAVDEYGLTTEGQDAIDRFIGVYASVIADDQFRDKIDSIQFEGHTDSSGDFDYNMELSQKRADSVMQYAIQSKNNGMTEQERNVMGQIAKATGYSFSDPVFNENGEEDMDASRRVAVKFYLKVNTKE